MSNIIGVGIKVDTAQLEAARRLLKTTGDMLDKTFDKTYQINMSGLKGFPSGPGPGPGYASGYDQTHMDKATRGAGQYRKEMSGVSDATSKIVKDYEKLIKITETIKNTGAGIPGISTVSSAESIRMRRESQKDADEFWRSTGMQPKRKTAAQQYFEQHGNYGRTVQSLPDDSHSGNGAGAGFGGLLMGAGKALGPLLGVAAGTAALYNWWNSSKESASKFETQNAFLKIRGGDLSDDMLRKRAKLGSGIPEQAEMYDLLNTRTGLQGKHLDSLTGTATTQGLLTGVGGRVMSQYFAGMFSNIGERSQEKVALSMNTAAVNLHTAAKFLGAGARYTEVLSVNQRLISSFVGSRGGEGMSDKSIGSVSAMQMALWGVGKIGQGASGANLLEGLNSGIIGGGSDPGAKIAFAKALGIDGVRSLDDLWNFRERQAEGASPRNIHAIMSLSERMGQGEAGKKLWLSGMFPNLTPFQTNAITKPGFRNIIGQLAQNDNKGAWKSIIARAVKENPDMFIGMTEESIMATLGLDTMRADAENQVTDLTTIGRPALRVGNAVKDAKGGALSVVKSLSGRTDKVPRPYTGPKDAVFGNVNSSHMTIDRPEATSTPSNAFDGVLLKGGGGVSEITNRLDTLIDLYGGKKSPAPPMPTIERFKGAQ